ncbi:NAD(P)-binding protein [Azospirillum argentinense]
MAKTRVAILGGGVGALTTAHFLSDTDEKRARYDVTIYQMGWRLGGKGATGRDQWNRIQEHGLHVWFGFYNNAFKMIQDVFDVWKRSPDNSFQSWRDVLKPQRFTPIGMVLDGGKPAYWPLTWPVLGGEPGSANVMPTLPQAIASLVGVVRDVFENWDELSGLIVDGKLVHIDGRTVAPMPVLPADQQVLPAPLATRFADAIRGWKDREVRHLAQAEALVKGAAVTTAKDAAIAAHRLIRALADGAQNGPGSNPSAAPPVEHFHDLMKLLRLIEAAAATLPSNHVARDLLAFVLPFTVGIIADFGIEKRTADSLDELEFTDWLIRHGGDAAALKQSCSLRTCYDTFMQYKEGDYRQPNWGAGVAAQSCVRMFATCRESVMWNMEAGMGEVIIAPIYQTLLQNGVKVKFFRRVEDIGLSDDRALVETVRLARQVDLADGGDDYQPLITVPLEDKKFLLAWPLEPLWDQIKDADKVQAALATNNSSLESHWCAWEPVGTETLQRGRDFDVAVLGISMGGFKAMNDQPTLAAELQAASPAFNAMTSNIGIIPTLSMQLWCGPDLQGLGWEPGQPAAVAGPEPWSIWAEMGQTLPYEFRPGGTGAPQSETPKSVHYICGVWQTGLVARPTTDLAVPKEALDNVTNSAAEWLDAYMGNFWPKATVSGHGGVGFNWNVLYDPWNGTGRERLSHQIIRANVDPTETLPGSAAGSTKFRLRTDASGFYNLFLAGCWVRTGFNTSCIEATVMSGMQAARAISGTPLFISGENFLNGALS